MSYIPQKAMHHAHAEPASAPLPDDTAPPPAATPTEAVPNSTIAETHVASWLIASITVGAAAIAVVAALSLRSSSAEPRARGRAKRKD